MKLRHPLSGATYSLLDDGTVLVEAHDGHEGTFRANGAWLKGALRTADPQFLGFIAGPSLPDRNSIAASLGTKHASPRAPTLNKTRRDSDEGRKEMDLGLDGYRALVTAASRGIGLAIAQTFADQGCDLAICAEPAGLVMSPLKMASMSTRSALLLVRPPVKSTVVFKMVTAPLLLVAPVTSKPPPWMASDAPTSTVSALVTLIVWPASTVRNEPNNGPPAPMVNPPATVKPSVPV